MKKTIATIAALTAVSASVFAQGTIALSDVAGSARVYNNATLASAPYTVEVLFAPIGTTIGNLTVANALSSGLTQGAIFSNTTINNGGFLDGNAITLNGITAGTGTGDTTLNVEIAILGWSGTYSSLSAAQAAGALTGVTQVFSNPTGGAGSPPATQANLVNWTSANNLVLTSTTVTPEPSTIVLGGLGAAALLLFRRRK